MMMVLAPKDRFLTQYTTSQIQGYRYSSSQNYGQYSQGIKKSDIGTPYVLSAPASFLVSPQLLLGKFHRFLSMCSINSSIFSTRYIIAKITSKNTQNFLLDMIGVCLTLCRLNSSSWPEAIELINSHFKTHWRLPDNKIAKNSIPKIQLANWGSKVTFLGSMGPLPRLHNDYWP